MNLKPSKVGRNDPCPCGSGLKYKKCCMGREGAAPTVDLEALYARKYRIRVKTPKDIEAIRRAGRLVVDTLALVAPRIRPGITTDDINTWVHEFTLKNGAVPAPLNYRGYPKSVCVSVNEVICHGIPGERVLKDGDIVNVDVTSILGGYYADANKTYYVGTAGPDARKIVGVARECLRRGMDLVKAGNTIGDIGWAIQTHAESQGCSVVREFVGHGIGKALHEDPQIPNFVKPGCKAHTPLRPGMTLAIEPMVNLGRPEVDVLGDRWTVVTRDRRPSAHVEHTVAVGEDGPDVLTRLA
jgi:methionyl aminopeptidase